MARKTNRNTRKASNRKPRGSKTINPMTGFTFAMLLDKCHLTLTHNNLWSMSEEQAQDEAASLIEHGLAFLCEDEYGIVSLVVDEDGAYEMVATGGDIRPLGEVIVHKLRCAKAGRDVKLSDVYIIRHDRDKRRRWSIAMSAYEEVDKPVHFHFYCFFTDRDHGMTVPEVAAALGMDENQIEKPKRGNNAIDNMKSYPTHIKYRDKTQYDPSEVVTILGKDYVELFCERREDWLKGRAIVARMQAAEDVDDIIDRARHGELTQDQLLLDDALYEVYSIPENTKKIDTALNNWALRRSAKGAADLKAQLFSTFSAFVYGAAGTGKSSTMEAFAIFCEKEFGWQTARLAPSHAMDEYNGEEIVFMNDVRSGAMSAEDWLGLFSPYEESTSSARYHNKSHVAPRLIIVTSNKDPFETFFFAKGVGGGDRSEAVDTFLRRLGVFATVLSDKDYGVYNVVLRAPTHVDPYHVYAGVWAGTNDFRVSRNSFSTKLGTYYTPGENADRLMLNWMLENVNEDGSSMSVFGWAAYMLAVLNRCSGNTLFDRSDTGVVQRLFETIMSRRAKAVEAGALLALPMPQSADDLTGDPEPEGMVRRRDFWVERYEKEKPRIDEAQEERGISIDVLFPDD